MVTVLEKDCFWALLNVHDLSWQAPPYSVDILLSYHRMVSPPLPPVFREEWFVISQKNTCMTRGGGRGGGKLTLQYLPVSLIVKDKSKIKLFSKLPSTVLKSHYSKPINSRDFQLRNSEKYFWNVIVLQGQANQVWEN